MTEPANDDDVRKEEELNEAVEMDAEDEPLTDEDEAAMAGVGPDDEIGDEISDEDAEALAAEAEGEVSEEGAEEDAAAAGPKAPMDPELEARCLRICEALLFASAEPLGERAIANRLPDGADVKVLLKRLKEEYAERGVNLVRAGSSWAFRTAPDLTDFLNKEVEVARKLSRAAIETLAIVAYHQPVTRAEIEEIRGVSISKGTMDVLLEAGWIRPRGRRQTPGRPLTWGTSDTFLDQFGLESIRDLPGVEELKAAGLLDASPAINAYRATAGGADGEGEDGEGEGGDEDALPDDPLDMDLVDEDEAPLDPDDGAGPKD